MTSVFEPEIPSRSGTPHNIQADFTYKAYFLPSDNAERTRLALQHSVILRGVGGKLVHAPVNLDKGGSVLESATGSGIWLQDLAKVVPVGTELIGADIQQKLFPQPSMLPPNLKFQTQSVLDFPKEWTNKYDFVHQRLLIFGLRDAEWRRALGEIYRVLKPGGWLQLFEIDDLEGSGSKLTEFKLLIKGLMELRGVDGFWPNGSSKWRRYVKEAGFVDVRADWHYTPIGKQDGQDGIHGKDNVLGVLRGSEKALISFGVLDQQEFDKLYEEFDQEMDYHPGMRSRYIMICAQKPSQ